MHFLDECVLACLCVPKDKSVLYTVDSDTSPNCYFDGICGWGWGGAVGGTAHGMSFKILIPQPEIEPRP